MEEDLKPTEMGDMENVIGPNKSLSKRKDKHSARTNAKKLKLSKLEEWGEKPVELETRISDWLTRSSRENQEGSQTVEPADKSWAEYQDEADGNIFLTNTGTYLCK